LEDQDYLSDSNELLTITVWSGPLGQNS
jgi:hypothetical protein